MSLLIDLAGQLVPHFSYFAARMTDGVMEGAVQRITDRTVDAGEGAFRHLVGLDGAAAADDEAALTPRAADELDSMVARLNTEERERLAAALTTWLENPRGRDSLVDLVEAPRSRPGPGPHISVESHGDYTTVIGSVGTLNQYPRDDLS
ncbi:hypothetical protein P8A18_18965 [Streptomyces castrisilvae]|uniref:Uncharacterized protein n=1 Tax=Streptomyces castrisilvae TaxID=3033811 RepID=A0ABY9HLG2_9ACTN|nr:hypothetical protein [Streptomyces sp. Mut1]WLQ35375.1 hypothetical protein P8A18_18965 [Streptomyces sp. Mut1]